MFFHFPTSCQDHRIGTSIIGAMRELALLAFILILGVVWSEAQSCGSCGSECQSACGTRHFRTCCFNYMKKRSPNPLPSLPMDPSLRLELWLAKSRHPFFQQKALLEELDGLGADPRDRNEQDGVLN